MTSFVPVYERDLVLASGKGVHVVDEAGTRYLDFAAGIGVNGLGYGDRKVVAAIRAQAGRLIHASNLYDTAPATALAERLSTIAFPARVFFCNSGTEANEAALKFARRVGGASGRTELVAFERAFHGRTMGALSLTWNEKYRAPFAPLVPGVRFVPFGDLAALSAVVGAQTAAVFVEPVQGEGGIRVADTAFLQGLSALCRERGALLVSDEVQCGLGRTGDLFAHQESGITPDIVCLAKPLGGGLPIGAVLVRAELAASLSPGDHGSTFGGNPVAAAAALAVLDHLQGPRFLEHVRDVAGYLREKLDRAARRRKSPIVEVRGRGLMLGIELDRPAAPVVKALRAKGVLVTRAGENVIRLLPPLVVTRSHVRAFLAALEESLAETAPAAA